MPLARFASAVGAAFLLWATLVHPAGAQTAPTEMTVASFGGAIDQSMKEIFKPFEAANNVTIRWIPATGAENVAKVAAARNAPEFDVAFLDNLSFTLGSKQGLFAKIDPATVTHFADLYPEAAPASKDGVVFGFYYTGIFYRTDEFEKRGWAPPTSWKDFARPEFCKLIGIMHPNTSFGLTGALMFAGGDPARMDDAVKFLGSLKACIPVLEPSAPKLEEKIQLGEYLVGANGTVRTIPLIRRGLPLKMVFPREGVVLGAGMVAPVAGARRPELAQKFVNWITAPAAQERILREISYSPGNRTVPVPPELKALGLLDNEQMKKAITVSDDVLTEQKRNWVRQIERAMAP